MSYTHWTDIHRRQVSTKEYIVDRVSQPSWSEEEEHVFLKGVQRYGTAAGAVRAIARGIPNKNEIQVASKLHCLRVLSSTVKREKGAPRSSEQAKVEVEVEEEEEAEAEEEEEEEEEGEEEEEEEGEEEEGEQKQAGPESEGEGTDTNGEAKETEEEEEDICSLTDDASSLIMAPVRRHLQGIIGGLAAEDVLGRYPIGVDDMAVKNLLDARSGKRQRRRGFMLQPAWHDIPVCSDERQVPGEKVEGMEVSSSEQVVDPAWARMKLKRARLQVLSRPRNFSKNLFHFTRPEPEG